MAMLEKQDNDDDDDDSDGPHMMLTEGKLKAKMDRMAALRANKVMKVSNLTCAMKRMGMWNEDESVNMDFFNNIFVSKIPNQLPLIFTPMCFHYWIAWLSP